MNLDNAPESVKKEYKKSMTVAAIGRTTINRHTGHVIEKKIIRETEMTYEELVLPLLIISENKILIDVSEKMIQKIFDVG